MDQSKISHNSNSKGNEKTHGKKLFLYGIISLITLTIAILPFLSNDITKPLCLHSQEGKTCRSEIPILVSATSRYLPFRMETTSGSQQPLVHNDKKLASSYPSMYTNSTLGFEKIYLINLQSKRARRSEMQLLFGFYNISYEIVNAIDGNADQLSPSKAEEKAIFGRKESHAKVWQMMLQNQVNSALIFEDDVDMDRRIHEQIKRLQEPFAVMLNIIHMGKNQTSLTSKDPWNTPLWDLLWFGQCTEEAWQTKHLPKNYSALQQPESFPILTYSDPTRSNIANYEKMFSSYGVRTHDDYRDSRSRLRLIQPARQPQCLSAYALTGSGAARALYQNAHRGELHKVEDDLNTLIHQGRLRAYTVNPPLFNVRVPHDGNQNDGEVLNKDGIFRPVPGKDGFTRGIDNSAREHLLADIIGDDQVLVKQQGGLP